MEDDKNKVDDKGVNPFDIINKRLDAMEQQAKSLQEENEKLRKELKLKDDFISANLCYTNAPENKQTNDNDALSKMVEEQKRRYRIK